MTYTIKINQTDSKLAENLLFYLKSLTQTKEYDFMQIIEDEDDLLSDSLKKELDYRFDHFLNHHQDYPDWEDVKHKYSRP